MPGAYLTENDGELWLDDLLLLGTTITPDGYRFRLSAQADSATWGNPVPITASVQRWKTDGAVASFTGYQNRAPAFKLFMYADTPDDLAAAERYLVKAAANASVLKWIPPAGAPDAAASVFELWTVQTDHQFDIADEMRLARLWQVTCEAKPWVRSDTLTTVAALTTSASPTVTPIDSCGSTTNWTTNAGYTVTTTGSSLKVSRTETVGAGFGGSSDIGTVRSLVRTAAVTGLAGTPYLVLNMAVSGAKVGGWLVYVGADQDSRVLLTKVAQVGTSYYYALPPGTTGFGYLEIDALCTVHRTGVVALTLDDVSATDSVAQSGFGTHKQLARTMKIGGSVPTSGSLLVASPSGTPLKVVLLHSRPDDASGFSPPLRQYRTSGPTTPATDGTAVSGKSEGFMAGGNPTGVITFTLPPHLPPQGSYAVVGRLFSNTVTTLRVAVNAAISGQSYLQRSSGQVTWAAVNTWAYGTLGQLDLPPQRVPVQSGAQVVITIIGLPGPGTISLDEVWLLDQTNGQTSIIDCGPTATRLWVDAPDADPDLNAPAYYIGTAGDRSDAVGVPGTQIKSLGLHLLGPDDAYIFTSTDGVADALVSGAFYTRGHTHPGNVA